MKFRMNFTFEFDSKGIKVATLSFNKKIPRKYVEQAIEFAGKMIGKMIACPICGKQIPTFYHLYTSAKAHEIHTQADRKYGKVKK